MGKNSKMDSGGQPSSPEEEPPRDPGVAKYHSYTNEDLEGHRAHSIYLGVHVPGARRRPRHRHHRHHHHHKSSSKDGSENRPVTPPSQRVQFILGEDDDDDGTHLSHPLFSEMETLTEMEGGELEWKETARWVKFEEDVEEGGERWSKPHVATLSLHSLFELRSFLLNGTVILDMDASSLEQITDLLLDNMINQGQLTYESREKFKDALLRKHKHLYEKQKNSKENGNMSRLPLIRSLAEIGRNHSSSKSVGSGFFRALSFSGGNNASVMSNPEGTMEQSPSSGSITQNHSANNLDGHEHKGNTHFMRKIPPGAEASNILVGEVPFLDKPVTAFVRLTNSANLGNLTEVPVPTRFLYIILGPVGGLPRYHEIGRAMATLLSDEVFHDVAYKAKNRSHLLAGIDEFLDAVTVLPPGEWDPAIRIEPPAAIPSQDTRKKKQPVEVIDEEEEEVKLREEAGLTRSGKLFGGLINDIKRKSPWYLSDYKDGISIQSIASIIFIYFACLTPIITFGGLLGEATENRIAALESLVAGLICGVTYGFFSGQPLTILGSTGPVLVFETILYDFCRTMEWSYLSFRLWIGIWSGIILLILVAIDASALVCFITRFTEENFATLIAFIFIYKAVEKVMKIGHKYPMEISVDLNKSCICVPFNETEDVMESTDWSNMTSETCTEIYNGTMKGDGHECMHYYPDVYLLSLILFFGTFLIAIYLKDFKSAAFFPAKIRQVISDFAVIIAILVMSGIDFAIGIHTPKLEVPSELKPTWSGRGWLIPPFDGNPWWTSIVALVPALLACILLFMDQQITAVIVNRKEHKLKKGGGYHLDLFILALLTTLNSIFGLPWFVAATVLSINHVNSLKLESECAAPGEKPQFLGVRENRLTHIIIFGLIGLSVIMTPILRKIPMPVLFGVFLYMGIAALKGIQLFDRILIMFMPIKYQPDYSFLRQVPLKKVHLFTAIQVACLAVLWVIKSFKQTSILFPLMLVVMIGVRKSLDWAFTQRELKILDDTLPEFSRKKRMENVDDEEDEEKLGKETSEGVMTIPLANGNVMKVPLNPINISEEMNKSGVWMDINKDQEKKPNSPTKNNEDRSRSSCKRCRRRKKSRTNDEVNGVANGHASDVEMNGTFVCADHSENECNTKESRLDYENESCHFTKKRGHKRDALNEDEKKRLSMMAEEDEEDEGITIKVTKS
ncbi:sodium bicarbonate cotransporter 3-like isoform X11 [Portunus trituberculatus]|uniref:sodium bicarbonate cotransporter 3-like isoform X11 n=1 Tax=Portunus trituberculatus TaxID=210409 RepID=UPI001E1CBCF6|nr:sodium bicarbonate cotransporter 3-like isoform X11 [Portunus trituberculatus]XP_045135618.1 sodium bicarbonate cotransporter 3-like isoform X11 [Portunus trituberculatus]XP_045135619.1 sodium bicarbonate cotransporter 3-like isoform X11 [Portunus trituberculatus]UOW66200.1 anion exchange protein [Portunus trituberculatus]